MRFEMIDKEGRKIEVEVDEQFVVRIEGREYRIKREDVPAIEMALTKYYRELMKKVAEKYLKRREESQNEDHCEGDRSRSWL